MTYKTSFHNLAEHLEEGGAATLDPKPSMADQSKIIFESKKASSKTLARVIHQCLTITAA